MKYVSFLYKNKPSYGILKADNHHKIILMEDIFKKLNLDYPENLLSFIEKYNNELEKEITSLLGVLTNHLSLDQVQLLAPIPYPRRNIFCIGKNYFDHIGEVKQFTGEVSLSNEPVVPEEPIFFTKSCYKALGHGEDIVIPAELARELDYETELVIVIGKQGVNIPKDQVKEYVFGYMIGNDLTARDIQRNRKQWFKGKSLDNASIFGPYLLSGSQVEFPPKLEISNKVNGELRQKSNTAKLIFSLEDIISDLSSGMTLLPGDIIMTGTPAGVGSGMKPPRFLQNGDVIEMEIESLGRLKNRIVVV